MQILKTSSEGAVCSLTFEALIFSHHPLKDHGDNLPDGGSCCVVGDVVLSEVQAETQHNCLVTTEGLCLCMPSGEPKFSDDAFVIEVTK